MNGGGSNDVPVESVTLNFERIKMTYTPAGEAPISTGELQAK
jgi:type VI protein secretion system component Hcp